MRFLDPEVDAPSLYCPINGSEPRFPLRGPSAGKTGEVNGVRKSLAGDRGTPWEWPDISNASEAGADMVELGLKCV